MDHGKMRCNMDKVVRSDLIRRALALVLALVVGLTFIPLLGSNAYAADEDPAIDNAEAVSDITDEDVDAAEESPVDSSAEELEVVEGEDADLAEISKRTDYYSMNVTRSGSTVNVKASIASPYNSKIFFDGLAVDGIIVRKFNMVTSVNTNVNMNDYAVGYHNIQLRFHASDGQLAFSDSSLQRTEFTARPTYKGVFDVYSTYVLYNPYSASGANTSYPLYMEYSADRGKTWKRSGYMRASTALWISQQFTIKGFKPDRNYMTRIRYGQTVSYNGKRYLFLGPVLYTGTYKTGKAKKPKIKSVKCKAVKVKFHKHRVAGHYEWIGSSLIWIRPYTEKYYTYKVKITVKLKKKPGTKGIWINGKFCKGNKKKYTATFTPQINYSSKKPRGKKWVVQVASYQSKSYGGYSPLYRKTKKLK